MQVPVRGQQAAPREQAVREGARTHSGCHRIGPRMRSLAWLPWAARRTTRTASPWLLSRLNEVPRDRHQTALTGHPRQTLGQEPAQEPRHEHVQEAQVAVEQRICCC